MKAKRCSFGFLFEIKYISLRQVPFINQTNRHKIISNSLEGQAMKQQDQMFTVAGTNIVEVKKQNQESGLSYNEVYALLAKTGGKRTSIYSDTNREKIRAKLNHQ